MRYPYWQKRLHILWGFKRYVISTPAPQPQTLFETILLSAPCKGPRRLHSMLWMNSTWILLVLDSKPHAFLATARSYLCHGAGTLSALCVYAFVATNASRTTQEHWYSWLPSMRFFRFRRTPVDLIAKPLHTTSTISILLLSTHVSSSP